MHLHTTSGHEISSLRLPRKHFGFLWAHGRVAGSLRFKFNTELGARPHQEFFGCLGDRKHGGIATAHVVAIADDLLHFETDAVHRRAIDESAQPAIGLGLAVGAGLLLCVLRLRPKAERAPNPRLPDSIGVRSKLSRFRHVPFVQTLIGSEFAMPLGDRSRRPDKQERKADHVGEGCKRRGVADEEAERRAWTTATGTMAASAQVAPDGTKTPTIRRPVKTAKNEARRQ